MSKVKTGNITIWKGKYTKKENGTYFHISLSDYVLVIRQDLKIEIEVTFKETIVLYIYVICWSKVM